MKANFALENKTTIDAKPVEQKKSGYERVDYLGEYWYIDSDSKVARGVDTYSNSDDEFYENANYFADQTLADNMARALLLWQRIRRKAVELCDPLPWDKGYAIFYDPENKRIFSTRWQVSSFGMICFDTEEHCRQTIDSFYDELLWYFTQFMK